jgi:hypothetical protein
MRALAHRARSIACFCGFLAFAVVRPAAADTLSVLWDPSPDATTAGYIVYVTMPGGPTNAYTVGNTTSFDYAGALDGQQYFFSVAAYNAGSVVGAHTAQISRYPNQAPALANPGAQSSTTGANVNLQLQGSDPDGGALTYTAQGLPPGLSLNGVGSIGGVPTAAGAYVVTASVTDGGSTDVETFTWTITGPAAPPQDNTPPAVVIAVPNGPAAPAVVVTTPPAAPAAPNVAANVVLPPVAPAVPTPAVPAPAVPVPAPATPPNVAPALATPQGAPEASPNAPARSLRGRVRLALSKESAASPQETNAPVTIEARVRRALTPARPADTAAPSSAGVAATSTTGPAPVTVPVTVQSARNTVWSRAKVTATTVTTDQPVITLAGSAVDNQVVSSVEWTTDRGLSGRATGTDTWIAAVPLTRGLNRITITVRDVAGNVSSSTVAVQYNARLKP